MTRRSTACAFALTVFAVAAVNTGAAGAERALAPPRLETLLSQPPVPEVSLAVWFQDDTISQYQPADVEDESGDEEEEGGISDNSFLVEEAYNQEPGVVQHIFNFVHGWDNRGGRFRTFDGLFTQEWPLGSVRHQFSYAIPWHRISDAPTGGQGSVAEGIGDIQLNYRYQLYEEDECCMPAMAPRVSVILHTGDEDEGLGTGEVGYQFNLPVSRELENWFFHFNAGYTSFPDVEAGVDPVLAPGFTGRTLNGYNVGASAIWKARQYFHVMLESVALWNDELTAAGERDHTFEWLISPGVRWAPYTEGSRQVVLGIATPIGISDDSMPLSLFLYLSIEHPFNARGEG
ncbi:MAG: hypothetical protein HYS13_23560 [Planctomycetia bacterium]|nr:hypothetical protein [Planctomycetia bacterium]